ncbi:MAG: hypothetical protein FWF06_03415 [Symbiobacteriaceae bacterium]|nr:hypothetical protein [Symbiobacteriaceae bacterium]
MFKEAKINLFQEGLAPPNLAVWEQMSEVGLEHRDSSPGDEPPWSNGVGRFANALRSTLALADALAELRQHLERKQALILRDDIAGLVAILIEETPIVGKVRRCQQVLDTELYHLQQKPVTAGYGLWLDEIYASCASKEQEKIVQLTTDLLFCRELQLQQQGLLQSSEAYYQSMVRFLSGVQQWTYDKPK